MLVCRNDDMLSHRKEHEWSVFATRSFVILSPETGLRAMIDRAMEAAGVAAEPLFNCKQPTTIGSLVNAGLTYPPPTRSPPLQRLSIKRPTPRRWPGRIPAP